MMPPYLKLREASPAAAPQARDVSILPIYTAECAICKFPAIAAYLSNFTPRAALAIAAATGPYRAHHRCVVICAHAAFSTKSNAYAAGGFDARKLYFL